MPFDNNGNHREPTIYESAQYDLQSLTEKYGDEIMGVVMRWELENIAHGRANTKAWKQLTDKYGCVF